MNYLSVLLVFISLVMPWTAQGSETFQYAMRLFCTQHCTLSARLLIFQCFAYVQKIYNKCIQHFGQKLVIYVRILVLRKWVSFKFFSFPGLVLNTTHWNNLLHKTNSFMYNLVFYVGALVLITCLTEGSFTANYLSFLKVLLWLKYGSK